MSIRARKRALVGAAGVLFAATVGVVAWGLGAPVRVPVPPAGRPPGGGATTRARSGPSKAIAPNRPSLARLKKLARRGLRPTVADAGGKSDEDQPDRGRASADERKDSPALSVRLLGIVREPGHSMALIETGSGEIEVCKAGESFEHKGTRVRVTRVGRGGVTLRHGSRESELVMPKRKP